MTLDVSVARADEAVRPAQRVESLRLDATGVVQGWFTGALLELYGVARPAERLMNRLQH